MFFWLKLYPMHISTEIPHSAPIMYTFYVNQKWCHVNIQYLFPKFISRMPVNIVKPAYMHVYIQIAQVNIM